MVFQDDGVLPKKENYTNHYVGWPTASNPYADPQLSTINALMVISHLRPVS
jgi:hypothetical protein